MTSSAAKKKVKSHVIRYKNGNDFQFTERHILYWFGVINRAAFRNKLPVPSFFIRNMPGFWGWCIADDNDALMIKLSTNIHNRELFIATLAHEMVHMHQYIYEGKMNHVGSFFTWKRFFKKHMQIEI